MRDWKLENLPNAKGISVIQRTTSGGSLQLLDGFSGKLLFHLTFNLNFWIFC